MMATATADATHAAQVALRGKLDELHRRRARDHLTGATLHRTMAGLSGPRGCTVEMAEALEAVERGEILRDYC